MQSHDKNNHSFELNNYSFLARVIWFYS